MMTTRKKIEKSEWIERLTTISSGNRKRKVNLESDGNVLSLNTSFRDMEYDPQGKGDTITVTLGDASDTYIHPVQNPTELNLFHKPDGELQAVEIKDGNGVYNIINFL